MSMTNYDAIMGNLQRGLDAAVKPLNDYFRMRVQNALEERARRQQLQDLAAQRDFIERQAQLQREHELRLEELRREPPQPALTERERQKIEKEAYEKARKDLESESLAEWRKQAGGVGP
jgi:hypothetical protein